MFLVEQEEESKWEDTTIHLEKERFSNFEKIFLRIKLSTPQNG